jgi:hypothetical protein
MGGGVRCWGYNGYGQLGDGTRSFTPVDVVAFLGAATPIPGVTPWGLAVLAALLVAVRVLGVRRGRLGWG